LELGDHYSYLEVDLLQIRHNLESIQSALPQHVIPVIKGNAHGLDTARIAAMLIGDMHCDVVACAQVCEAVKIRQAGFSQVKIMLLSAVPIHALDTVVKCGFLIPVFDCTTVYALSEIVRQRNMDHFDIQIKVDTGLHRIGVPVDQLHELLEAIEKAGNLRIAGIYTHYANAYQVDDPFTIEQYQLFEKAVAQVRSRGHEPTYIHAGCSGSASWMVDTVSTHIRIGWGYIAFTPITGLEHYFDSRQAVSLRAFVTAVYSLERGQRLGYGGGIWAEKDMTTATISIGFCDGFPKQVADNHAPVLLNGKIGRCLAACMDQIFVDVTGIPCKIGDEVTLFGRDKCSDLYLTTAEVAAYGDGNPTGLHACLTDRVKRVYIP